MLQSVMQSKDDVQGLTKKDVKKMEETLYQRRRLQREEDCERHPSVGERIRGRQRAPYALSIREPLFVFLAVFDAIDIDMSCLLTLCLFR